MAKAATAVKEKHIEPPIPKDAPKRFSDLGRRNDSALWVDPNSIVVRENVRNFNLPDNNRESLIPLSESIAKHGVQTPLIVEFIDGKCLLVDGERRLRATKIAIENGAVIPQVPVFKQNGPTLTQEERIANQLRFNIGKPNSQLEIAAAYAKLIAKGWTVEKIATWVSVTQSNVSHVLKLNDAPEALRDLVAEGTISASEATKQVIVRGGDKAARIVTKAVKVAKKEGRTRVTAKHIAAVTGEKTAREVNEDAQATLTSIKDTLYQIRHCQDIKKIHRLASSALSDLGYDENESQVA